MQNERRNFKKNNFSIEFVFRKLYSDCVRSVFGIFWQLLTTTAFLWVFLLSNGQNSFFFSLDIEQKPACVPHTNSISYANIPALCFWHIFVAIQLSFTDYSRENKFISIIIRAIFSTKQSNNIIECAFRIVPTHQSPF